MSGLWHAQPVSLCAVSGCLLARVSDRGFPETGRLFRRFPPCRRVLRSHGAMRLESRPHRRLYPVLRRQAAGIRRQTQDRCESSRSHFDHGYAICSCCPPLVIEPALNSVFYIGLLLALVAAGQQQNQLPSRFCVVDPVAGAVVDTQLPYPVSDGFAVSESPSGHTVDAQGNPCLCGSILQAIQPILIKVSARGIQIMDDVVHWLLK